MFARITIIGRGAGRLLRTLILALLAAVAGCDQKPRWRGVLGPTPGMPGRPRTPIPPPGAPGHGGTAR